MTKKTLPIAHPIAPIPSIPRKEHKTKKIPWKIRKLKGRRRRERENRIVQK
jgi:hypothetical protein